ncbi:MAG: hypothetical protein WC627_10960 [Legionella sp.]|jgi:hypothetical protein
MTRSSHSSRPHNSAGAHHHTPSHHSGSTAQNPQKHSQETPQTSAPSSQSGSHDHSTHVNKPPQTPPKQQFPFHNTGHVHQQKQKPQERESNPSPSNNSGSLFNMFGMGYLYGMILGQHHQKHEGTGGGQTHSITTEDEINSCAFFARSLPGYQNLDNITASSHLQSDNKDDPNMRLLKTRHCLGLFQSLSEIKRADMVNEIRSLERENSQSENFEP